MEKVSKWKVASTTKRAGSPIPELMVGTKDNLKLNEAASRLLDIPNKSYLSLVNSGYDVTELKFDTAKMQTLVRKTGEEVFYGVCKGLPVLAADGSIIETIEDGETVNRYQGCKMSNANGTAGFSILMGSDAKNWAPLGGNKEMNMIYEIITDEAEEVNLVDMYEGATEEMVMALAGQTVIIYPIRFSRTEDKIVRGSKGDSSEE
jgi:hypothetical protein